MTAIDAAWRRVSAALPVGWELTDLYQLPSDRAWMAGASKQRLRVEADERREAFGLTPVEALEALAAAVQLLGGPRRDDGDADLEPFGPSIDEAWAEALRDLPAGWTIRHLYRPPATELWMAMATLERSTKQPGDHAEAFGRTPAAALRALGVTLGLKPA
jgi:hypothetical protein